MSAKSGPQKQEILSGLIETRAAILNAASQFPPEMQDTIFLGTWSVKDLIAHLAGWDSTNSEAARDVQEGKVPEFYGQYDRDWKTYNADPVARYKRDDFGQLLALVKNSHRQLIEYMQTIPPEAFTKDFGVRARGVKVTIARLLRAELQDEKIHLKQIQEFRVQI